MQSVKIQLVKMGNNKLNSSILRLYYTADYIYD